MEVFRLCAAFVGVRGAWCLFGLITAASEAQAIQTSVGVIDDQTSRDWIPDDSVRLRYFVDPDYPSSWLTTGGSPFRFSHDGRRFLTLTRSGNPATDADSFELTVWDAHAIDRALKVPKGEKLTPLRVATWNSKAGVDRDLPFTRAKFDRDGDGVIFTAADRAAVRSIYRLDIRSGEFRLLSSKDLEVQDYGSAMNRTVYTTYPAARPRDLPPIAYPLEAIARRPKTSDDSPLGVFNSTRSISWKETERLVYVRHPDGRHEQLHNVWLARLSPDIGLSPDGNHLIAIELKDDAPRGYISVDLRTGARKGLFDAGGVQLPEVTWSPMGRYVALVAKNDAGLGYRIYDFQKGSLIPVSIKYAEGLRWISEAKFCIPSKRTGVAYEIVGVSIRTSALKSGPTCDGIDKAPRGFRGTEINLVQSENTPQIVVASKDGRSLKLTSPDEITQNVRWAKADRVEWQAPDGRMISGALRLPHSYRQGSPVPLVIQAYGYEPALFQPDGYIFGSVDSAQSLAANGIAVLQIDAWAHQYSDMGAEPELHRYIANLNTSVGQLIERGIADPDRIGITGFSRAGFLAHFAISHPDRLKFKLAAAIINDSFKGYYSSMIGPYGGGVQDYNVYGGPFWKNKGKWLELENSFNIDHVVTPTLFAENTNASLYPELRNRYFPETINVVKLFDLNRKPMDYVIFPDGQHGLQRPRERLEMHRLTVDWMAFWLRGKLPVDKSRADRWLKLRQMQQHVLDELTAKGQQVAPLPPLKPAFTTGN